MEDISYDIFKQFLVSHHIYSRFGNLTMINTGIKHEIYFDSIKNKEELISSAFTWSEARHPEDMTPLEKNKFWKKISSKWRSIIKDTKHVRLEQSLDKIIGELI